MAETSPFAKRLREARTRAGISQKELGIRAGIDAFSASPRINQYEKGKHIPDLATAERLAAVLRVPAAFFYTNDDIFAEIILKVGELAPRQRRRLLSELETNEPKKGL